MFLDIEYSLCYLAYGWYSSGGKCEIRIDATRYLQTCCKFLKQLASNLWTTCSRLVITKPEQAMQTHPDIVLMNARKQACSTLHVPGYVHDGG